MQGVFNPNILIYHPPNSTEGLHFSAFHYIGDMHTKKVNEWAVTSERSVFRIANSNVMSTLRGFR